MTEAYVHRKGEYTLLDVLERVRRNPEVWKAGAIIVFIGVVRGETLNGGRVKRLSVEAYEEGTNRVLAEIIDDLESREGIVDVQIHHLTGEFDVGDELVYVAVAGRHRDQIFPVLREAIERYKSEAPIFKKESIVDDKGEEKTYWVSEKDFT
ncbi:MAG: molybdenum cofactor biosynthesis protein MoaE [Candidatus Bathyarchaeia archaeon]